MEENILNHTAEPCNQFLQIIITFLPTSKCGTGLRPLKFFFLKKIDFRYRFLDCYYYYWNTFESDQIISITNLNIEIHIGKPRDFFLLKKIDFDIDEYRDFNKMGDTKYFRVHLLYASTWTTGSAWFAMSEGTMMFQLDRKIFFVHNVTKCKYPHGLLMGNVYLYFSIINTIIQIWDLG